MISMVYYIFWDDFWKIDFLPIIDENRPIQSIYKFQNRCDNNPMCSWVDIKKNFWNRSRVLNNLISADIDYRNSSISVDRSDFGFWDRCHRTQHHRFALYTRANRSKVNIEQFDQCRYWLSEFVDIGQYDQYMKFKIGATKIPCALELF